MDSLNSAELIIRPTYLIRLPKGNVKFSNVYEMSRFGNNFSNVYFKSTLNWMKRRFGLNFNGILSDEWIKLQKQPCGFCGDHGLQRIGISYLKWFTNGGKTNVKRRLRCDSQPVKITRRSK